MTKNEINEDTFKRAVKTLLDVLTLQRKIKFSVYTNIIMIVSCQSILVLNFSIFINLGQITTNEIPLIVSSLGFLSLEILYIFFLKKGLKHLFDLIGKEDEILLLLFINEIGIKTIENFKINKEHWEYLKTKAMEVVKEKLKTELDKLANGKQVSLGEIL